MIHDRIIQNLGACDLVLVDLSQFNPNVYFELGVRTSLNKPVCLVKDESVKVLPFDTSGMNTGEYQSALHPWTLDEQIERLAEHIEESADSCDGENPLWRQYGLSIRAQEPTSSESPLDAKVDLLTDRVTKMMSQISTAPYDEMPITTRKFQAVSEEISEILEAEGITTSDLTQAQHDPDVLSLGLQAALPATSFEALIRAANRHGYALHIADGSGRIHFS